MSDKLAMINAAMLGVALVFVTQLSSADQIDTPLTVALYCFAIAIPYLTARLFMARVFTMAMLDERVSRSLQGSVSVQWLDTAINLLIIFGVGAIFWHFAWPLGVVFGLSVLLSPILIPAVAAAESAHHARRRGQSGSSEGKP